MRSLSPSHTRGGNDVYETALTSFHFFSSSLFWSPRTETVSGKGKGRAKGDGGRGHTSLLSTCIKGELKASRSPHIVHPALPP